MNITMDDMADGQGKQRQLTAMCIDDEVIDLKLNERVLARSGEYGEVLNFSMAEDALEHLRANRGKRIDVIFLDINMPRMSGFDFLEAAVKELGRSFAKCVVVMLTTSLHQRDKDRAESIGAIRDYLAKPITVEEARRVAQLARDAE